MAGMVDVNASMSASSSATSGSHVSANTGGVFYKTKPETPWMTIALAGIAGVLCVIFLIRR